MMNFGNWTATFMKKKPQNSSKNDVLKPVDAKVPQYFGSNEYSKEPVNTDKKFPPKNDWDSQSGEGDYFDAKESPQNPSDKGYRPDYRYSTSSTYRNYDNDYDNYHGSYGSSKMSYGDNDDDYYYKNNSGYQYPPPPNCHYGGDGWGSSSQKSDDRSYFRYSVKRNYDFEERKRQVPPYLTVGNRVIYQKHFEDIFEMINDKSDYVADGDRYCEIFSGFIKVHHPQLKFLCPYCDKLSRDCGDLFSHIKDIHGPHYIQDGFWCQKCECPLLGQCVLQRHVGFCRKTQWYEKVRGYPCYF